LLPSCDEDPSTKPKLIVLGFDGMDPKLCEQMLAQGRLPTLATLRDMGGFRPLGTSTPPQSPVAWSNFITGTDPGAHGIFDFIHRNPQTLFPYESTAETESGSWPLHLGKYVFYLRGGKVVNLRKGQPFWEYLTEAGVPVQIYRMPAIYPPQKSEGASFQALTDMGTPDILGTNGTFSFYTSGPARVVGGGGEMYPLRFKNDVAKTAFHGPADPNLIIPEGKYSNPPLETPLTIYRDPTDPTARLVWQDQEVLLSEGEWSDWYPLTFESGPRLHLAGLSLGIPGGDISAMARFYLKQVRPIFELYISPLNIDPLNPALPVSEPARFATEVAGSIGRYYTQGLPEETKGLSHGILTRDEFLQQADRIREERERLLDYALDHYRGGFLFFYFGSTDQVGHMLWGARTAGHPALTEEEHEKYQHAMEELYEHMDRDVAKVIQRFPGATVLVMSDHGFETFTRQFNVNTWLVENGYAAPYKPADYGYPMNFKWSRTRAYACGINGLYLNLQGREREGIVPPARKQALMDEIAAKLLEYRDPQSGKPVIKEVYQADKVYHGPNIGIGPDMQIGYDRTFRGSWTAALGQISKEIMEDNTDAWCADHCVATDLVPGVLFSTRPLGVDDPDLLDLAPTILESYGVSKPSQMRGRNVFAKPP